MSNSDVSTSYTDNKKSFEEDKEICDEETEDRKSN